MEEYITIAVKTDTTIGEAAMMVCNHDRSSSEEMMTVTDVID